jgi:hypothetical protein
MSLSFWSDEDRWFVPRRLGIGYSLNFKYVAKRLGLLKSPQVSSQPPEDSAADVPQEHRETREERLRRQVESSKYEERE